MYIAFNQLVFLILCSCCMLHMTGLCAFRRSSTLKHPILLLNPSFKSCIAIEANLNKDLQKMANTVYSRDSFGYTFIASTHSIYFQFGGLTTYI